MNLEQLLEDKYGYRSFRTGQKEIISEVLNGRDVLALLPTGMGKSLCYQLPGHVLPGSVLIVSPLLSLMQDQVAQLKKMGEKSVVAINSFLKAEEKEQIWQAIGDYRFIFISPEMLLQPQVIRRLQRITIALVVADEAHCISQWGFDFRPDYLRIAEVLPALGAPQVLALTATATKKVEQDIRHYLQLDDPVIYIHPMDRKNIAYDLKNFRDGEEKREWLLAFAETYEGPGIVYAGTRRKAEELAGILTDNGLPAAFYHGGMEQQDRIFIQQQFQNGEINWVCSTNAFGMGIHVPNVRHVIHFQIPTAIEEFVQEVGRAGRDGLPALATLLMAPGDEKLMQALLIDELPTRHEIEAVASDSAGRVDLVEAGIVRETSYRVIRYWLGRMTPEQTIVQIERLAEDKLMRAASMTGLAESGKCLRAYILGYFDQQLQEHPENCCLWCGIDYEPYPLRTTESEESESLHWQQRLSRLLP
ncbi:RecQ family ATP-dependent DNA helicase [Planococcus lenghuensis]|uniref:ATP-dependent DNA helicase n=1 Tax=Planococcus lenghuensis TaxID=2213202 RepID=A0A1Q2KZR2_9BACL|nr:ATP-dependent DNA helicase RecQ [Planococcus lenghuensis]AQQ53646.1 ATP-dependent DNA helicase [Planococcus lenghuensis]